MARAAATSPPQDFETNDELRCKVVSFLEEVMHDPELLTQERKAAANIIRSGQPWPLGHGCCVGPSPVPTRPARGREPGRASLQVGWPQVGVRGRGLLSHRRAVCSISVAGPPGQASVCPSSARTLTPLRQEPRLPPRTALSSCLVPGPSVTVTSHPGLLNLNGLKVQLLSLIGHVAPMAACDTQIRSVGAPAQSRVAGAGWLPSAGIGGECGT